MTNDPMVIDGAELDELDLALGDLGAPAVPGSATDIDAALEAASGMDNVVPQSYDLGGVQWDAVPETDFRPLTDKAWYVFRVARIKYGLSKKGNEQATVLLKVVQAENKSELGVTLEDYVPTPRSPKTAEQLAQLGKMKRILKFTGCAEINLAGEVIGLAAGVKGFSDVLGKEIAGQCAMDDTYNPGDPRAKIARYSYPNTFGQPK